MLWNICSDTVNLLYVRPILTWPEKYFFCSEALAGCAWRRWPAQRLRPTSGRVLQRIRGRGDLEPKHKSQRGLPLPKHRGASKPPIQPHCRCHGKQIKLDQVWSLTQFYSVDFSQSRIGVKKCVFNKRTIKVCVSCGWQCRAQRAGRGG